MDAASPLRPAVISSSFFAFYLENSMPGMSNRALSHESSSATSGTTTPRMFRIIDYNLVSFLAAHQE